MKRWIGNVALVGFASFGVAQAPFNITRPYEGERIKEKVSMRFPLGSVPKSGYIGVYLNGRLIEATRPTYVKPMKNGKVTGRAYLEYVLDAKGRGINDTAPGKTDELKAVLFDEVGETPRKLAESSVNIVINKRYGINVPSSGIKLRYRWKAGDELIYRMEQKQVVSTITENQQKAGGKAAEFPQDGETIRMLYAVDKVTPRASNGPLALLRMQPLPSKGKDWAELTVSGEDAPKRYYDYEMAPIYMELTETGIQKWGSIPFYTPFGGTAGQSSLLDLFAAIPLPTLPQKAISVGDSWQSNFQSGVLDLEKLYEVTSVVRTFKARGEFVGVEWEQGRPCAKIQNVIDVGARSLEGNKASSLGDAKVTLNETVWFDLDSRRVLKAVREETIEVKADSSTIAGLGFGGATASSGSASGGAAPGAGAPPAGGAPRGPQRGGGLAGSGGGDKDSILPDNGSIDIRQRAGGPQGPPGGFPGAGNRGGFPGAGGGGGRGGFPGGNFGNAPAVQQNAFLQVRSLRILTLEK